MKMIFSFLFAVSVFAQFTTIPSGLGTVGGASNLTTVGAIPYVSAAGILNQDPTALFWDAANDRLGVGTNAPGTTINATGGAIALEKTSGGFVSSLSFQGNNAALGHYSQTALLFGTQTTASGGGFAEQARLVGSTGNLLIGTTTDSNFKLDVATSGSAGTMRVYDATATTGTTRMVVRAGAGQSTNNLQEWQNAAGNNGVWVMPAGSSLQATAGIVIGGGAGAFSAGYYSSGLDMSSAWSVGWSSTTGANGAKDLSLSRASAGVLQVGDGGSNANGEIQTKIHTWINGTEATCNSTTRGEVVMVQGGAGVADTLRVCRKDAADAYAWTALY